MLEPEVYQHRANTNEPNTRTTFYPQHHKHAFAQQDEADAEEVVEMAAAEEQKEVAAAEAAPAESEGALVADPPLPTEKVSIIEPMAYENRNNYALPYMRSTFYDRKHHGASKHRVMFAQQDPVEMDGEKIAAGEEKSRAAAKQSVLDTDLDMKRAIVDSSEKTSILEPDVYENRSNYALPFMRTTFFSQKHPQYLGQTQTHMHNTLKSCGRGFRYSCEDGEECHHGYCYTDGGWEGWDAHYTF